MRRMAEILDTKETGAHRSDDPPSLPTPPWEIGEGSRDHARWGAQEREYLRFHAGEKTVETIARHLRRTKRAVLEKLVKMGLRRQRTHITLNTASKRFGYSDRLILRIAEWGGVKVRRANVLRASREVAYRDAQGRQRRYMHRLFDVHDLKAAVERWEQSPNFTELARKILRTDMAILRRVISADPRFRRREGETKVGHRRYSTEEVEQIRGMLLAHKERTGHGGRKAA